MDRETQMRRDHAKHVKACRRKGFEPSSLEDFKVLWERLHPEVAS